MFSLILSLIQDTSEFTTSTHGRHNSAPEGIIYYLVFGISAIIVIAVFVWAIKYLFWPGEKGEDHIKRQILEDDLKNKNDNSHGSKGKEQY